MLDGQRERRAIDDMLDVVRNGFSGVLVVRGGPGCGKDHAPLNVPSIPLRAFKLAQLQGWNPKSSLSSRRCISW